MMIIDPYRFAVASLPDTWSPTNKSAEFTLSESNMRAATASASSTYGALGEYDFPVLRDSTALTRCAEFVIMATGGGFVGVGVAPSNFVPSTGQGSSSAGFCAVIYRSPGGICASGCTSGKPTFTVGDVIGVVVDSENHVSPTQVTMLCKFYKNGVLVANGIADGAATTYNDGQAVSLFVSAFFDASDVRVRTDPAAMQYFANYGADIGWPAASP